MSDDNNDFGCGIMLLLFALTPIILLMVFVDSFIDSLTKQIRKRERKD